MPGHTSPGSLLLAGEEGHQEREAEHEGEDRPQRREEVREVDAEALQQEPGAGGEQDPAPQDASETGMTGAHRPAAIVEVMSPFVVSAHRAVSDAILPHGWWAFGPPGRGRAPAGACRDATTAGSPVETGW